MSGSAGPALAGGLARLDLALGAGLRLAGTTCLVTLLVLVAAGVLVRFVPVSSMGWADELVELAFAWMVFLGAAALWREQSHFRVELVQHLLGGGRLGHCLEIGVSLACLVFLAVFTLVGWTLTVEATDRSPILELPRRIFYGVMPLSGAVMAGYTLRDLWRLGRGGRRPSGS